MKTTKAKNRISTMEIIKGVTIAVYLFVILLAAASLVYAILTGQVDPNNW
jgi:hypothetical protein